MSFDVRDPKFTARLETALIFLTKNSDVSVAYLTRRYDLEVGTLQLWLDTFNGGQKTLTIGRIGEVKSEVGAVSVAKPTQPVTAAAFPPASAPAVAVAPVAAAPATVGEIRVKRTYTRRTPLAAREPIVAAMPALPAPPPIVVNDPLAMTLVAGNKSLGDLIARQLNQSLGAFRYEVDVRLVPVAPKAEAS